MITSGQNDITRTVKWWRLENFPDEASYRGTEPELSEALRAARVEYVHDHPEDDRPDMGKINVTVDPGGKIVISYETGET